MTGNLLIGAAEVPAGTGTMKAATDSRFTSVGITAIERFLRPVTYQGFPDELLPEALNADNRLGLWRLVDGALIQE